MAAVQSIMAPARTLVERTVDAIEEATERDGRTHAEVQGISRAQIVTLVQCLLEMDIGVKVYVHKDAANRDDLKRAFRRAVGEVLCNTDDLHFGPAEHQPRAALQWMVWEGRAHLWFAH